MPGFREAVLHGRTDTWQDGGLLCRSWKKVHMVEGREDPNQLCWELVNHQEPFHISGYFQGWLPCKGFRMLQSTRSCCIPAALLTEEGAEQCGDFPGVRMVHPVPPSTPLRTRGKLPARALHSIGSRERVQ